MIPVCRLILKGISGEDRAGALRDIDEAKLICRRLAYPRRSANGVDRTRGSPCAPPLDAPRPPTKAERMERGQSVLHSLRTTMLKRLRLLSIRSFRVENSRNPGLRPALL